MKSAFVCLALVLSASYIFAADPQNNGSDYLALGDSLAFGYNPLVQPPSLSKYIGYPKIVAGALDLALSNASCPGETTDTFLNPASMAYYPGFSCTPQYNQVFVPDPKKASGSAQLTFFVNYNGALSQMEYATDFLTSHPTTKLVTIDIGLNDVALFGASCATDPNPQQCLGPVLIAMAENLGTILGTLRNSTPYRGPIVVLDAFSPNYANATYTGAIAAYNSAVQAVVAQAGPGVIFDDLFNVFGGIAARFDGEACRAGVLVTSRVALPWGNCDTHPTVLGQAIIASTVVQSLAGHN